MKNVAVNWRELAHVDRELTGKWINRGNIVAHNVDIDLTADQGPIIDVKGFLDSEYGRSMKNVTYEPVDYLPRTKFTSLGVFAKRDIGINSEVEGLIGFLSDIDSREIENNYNDFSIMFSSRANEQWIMLGPISFVNASCKPNIAYIRSGKLMSCAPLRPIREGEELTVFYSRHFFGSFNELCCCPFKSLHGNPFPEIVSRKRKTLCLTSTPCKPHKPKPITSEFSYSRHGMPSRSQLQNEMQKNEIKRSKKLDYDAVFSGLDSSSSNSLSLASILSSDLPSPFMSQSNEACDRPFSVFDVTDCSVGCDSNPFLSQRLNL